MRLASQRFFIHSCIYLRILIISYLATLLGTNSLSVLMCRKAVNQSTLQLRRDKTTINQPLCPSTVFTPTSQSTHLSTLSSLYSVLSSGLLGPLVEQLIIYKLSCNETHLSVQVSHIKVSDKVT